jgi:hypothetical protein
MLNFNQLHKVSMLRYRIPAAIFGIDIQAVFGEGTKKGFLSGIENSDLDQSKVPESEYQ